MERVRLLKRGLAALSIALATVVATAAPAAADGRWSGPTNDRIVITSVLPPVRGLHVQLVVAGTAIRVTNSTGEDVVVFGYQNEPYLRITSEGTFENRRSPTLYSNATPEQLPPETALVGGQPDWIRRSASTTAIWHDLRLQGGVSTPSRWNLRLTVADRDVTVAGRTSRVPPGSPWPWLIAFAAIVVVVFESAIRPARAWQIVLASALSSAVLLDMFRALGDFSARVDGTIDDRLLRDLLFPGVGWVLAVMAIRSLLRRSSALPPAAGFAGLSLLVLGGLGNLGVLRSTQLVFGPPPWIERAAIVLALAVGGALVAAFARDILRPSPESGIGQALAE